MLDNIKRIIFPNEQYEDDDYDEVYPGDVEEPEFSASEGNQYDTRNAPKSKNQNFYRTPKPNGEKSVNNVVGMPGITNSNAEVSVITPRSFEEMPEVIHALRERKSVILNLNMMNPEEAQRAVDFVSGGTYAMDGQYERVGESIFLFTPSCVKVSIHSDVIDDLTNSSNSGVRRPTPKNQDYWQEVSAVGQ